MKKVNKIHNLDSLEREIYRLRIEAARKEKNLSENITYLRENATRLFVNTFRGKYKPETDEKRNENGSFFRIAGLNSIFSKIADRIANRAADNIDDLIDRIFHKQKHKSNE